jgi:muramidase (phage lysozyme)
MKTQNMTSNNGNKVANQFVITDDNNNETFQSYDSIIAKTEIVDPSTNPRHLSVLVYLDSTYWNYSKTTAKYRNQFLNETTKETQAKIDSGEYILTDLNN